MSRDWNLTDPLGTERAQDDGGHVFGIALGVQVAVGCIEVIGLARLEGAAVLSALLGRVGTVRLAGKPLRKRNNLIRSFASLPVEVCA